MASILPQIFALLVEPPGNLVYHLVLIFAALAALQSVNLLEFKVNQLTARRLKIGFIVILAAQAILFGISALGWQNLLDTQIVLPPLDRAVIAATLLWIAWMVLFPAKNSFADWTIIVLTLGLAGFFAYSLIHWTPVVGQAHFNTTPLDYYWASLFLAISLVCGIMIIFMRPENWGTGLGIFLLSFMGSLLHLTTPFPSSDFPAAMRLALICIFPLLPGLARTLRGFNLFGDGEEGQRRSVQPIDIKLPLSWAQLAENHGGSSQSLPFWVKAVGYASGADFWGLISSAADGSINFSNGWDKNKQQPLAVKAVPAASSAVFQKILRGGKAVLISDSDPSLKKEIHSLENLFPIPGRQEFMVIPTAIPDASWGGLLFSRSAKDEQWHQSDIDSLNRLIQQTNRLITSGPDVRTPEPGIGKLEKILENTKKEVLELREERRLLLEELESMRFDDHSLAGDLTVESLMAVQRESHDSIASLEAENELLRIKLAEKSQASPSLEAQYIEQELRSSLEETAHLQNALAEASITIMNLQQRSVHPGQITEDEKLEIGNIIQKIYGPVSSLVAYTNLLSSETGGKLGPLQHNFIDRIHSSSDQLKLLLDELMNTVNKSFNTIELVQQPVSFDEVIDQAVGDITPLFKEKNITLQVYLPENVPSVHADRDALQQIVIHMLQNAAGVTPDGGTITFRANLANEQGQDNFLSFHVTDEGGGISPEEIGKVFNREYRMDHPTIAGLGDSGNGLVIARTLVEAHNGRIWVESNEPGKATISVLLPLEKQSVSGISQDK